MAVGKLIVGLIVPILMVNCYRDGCQRAAPFDQLILAIQSGRANEGYSPDFSKSVSWSIHGLWPWSKKNYGYAFCCGKNQLSTGSLTNLYNYLKTYWFSLKRDDSSFWNYQWKKHGTCAAKYDYGNPNQYFDLGIKLFRQIDLEYNLKRRGLIRTWIPPRELHQLLYRIYGVKTQISCKDLANKKTVSEIRFCFNPDNFQLVDCGTQNFSRCNNLNKQLASQVYIF